jgi:hypothetical protein
MMRMLKDKGEELYKVRIWSERGVRGETGERVSVAWAGGSYGAVRIQFRLGLTSETPIQTPIHRYQPNCCYWDKFATSLSQLVGETTTTTTPRGTTTTTTCNSSVDSLSLLITHLITICPA